MAADPNNAAIWANADVYVAPVGTAIPADASTAFSGSWTLLGLLDGDDGFVESRTVDEADHFAWGGILVKTSRKNFKITKKFTVLEDNAAVRALIWPGSSSSQLIVPTPGKVMLAFETRDSTGKVRRMITNNYAQVDLAGDILDNESDLKKVQLEATIFPSAAGVLFDLQGKPILSSIAITALTLALTASGNQIKKLVATGTYSDASTGDLSALVTWASSDIAKATVESPGYVRAVAAGTTNITCTYAGVTSTAPSVVTVS
jgi:hypothetical protein